MGSTEMTEATKDAPRTRKGEKKEHAKHSTSACMLETAQADRTCETAPKHKQSHNDGGESHSCSSVSMAPLGPSFATGSMALRRSLW